MTASFRATATASPSASTSSTAPSMPTNTSTPAASRACRCPRRRKSRRTIPFFNIKPQTSTTYEIGTRGRRPDYTWDVTLYRSDIQNELQCFYSAFGNCNVTNADRTVHQGVEAGFGVSLVKGLASPGIDP